MDVKLSGVSSKLARARTLVVALTLMVGMGLGFSMHDVAFAQQGQQQGQQMATPSDLSRVFINVAKQVKPAVVNIDVVEKPKRSASRGFEGLPQIPGFPQFGDMQPREQKGTGSGVIISSDGYILTNNHVAGEADEIKVKLADGRQFKAKRIGTDPETDLAVVKIEATNLPFARLGNSENLEQGEWVIALGSPFGLQQTMTAGIVSATGRELNEGGQFTRFIQTDASINPGNSGGPLVNMQGEVVGINTMIYSRTGGSVGIGFAIPSNLVNNVYAQLIKNGKVTRAYLGVFPGEVTPAIARAASYNGDDGALVNDIVREDSPAAKAGLHSGDIITEVDGKSIKTARDLVEIVANLPVGKDVPVKYVRNGRLQTTTVKLAERPAAEDAEQQGGEKEEGDAGKLGIFPQTVSPEIARQLKLRIKSGVVIQNVQPGSPASEAGLQQGDVIHRVNSTEITNNQDLVNALKTPNKEVVLQIERDGRLTFVTVSVED